MWHRKYLSMLQGMKYEKKKRKYIREDFFFLFNVYDIMYYFINREYYYCVILVDKSS